MKFTSLDQFHTLSEKLTEFGATIEKKNEEQDLLSPAYQKACERLQRSLANFGSEPSNLDKLDLMLAALERYQTANEMLRLKLQAKLGQLDQDQSDAH